MLIDSTGDNILTDDLNYIRPDEKYQYNFSYLGKGIFFLKSKGQIDEKTLKLQLNSGDIARDRLIKKYPQKKYHLIWDITEVSGASLLSRRMMFMKVKESSFGSVTIIGANIFARNFARIIGKIIKNIRFYFFRTLDEAIQNLEEIIKSEIPINPDENVFYGIETEAFSRFIDIWQRNQGIITIGDHNLKYITKSEWTYESSDNNYKVNVYLIEGNIVYYRCEGFIKANNIDKTYKILDNIIQEFRFNNTDNKFYSVVNIKKLKGMTLASRKRTLYFENIYRNKCHLVIAIPSYVSNILLKIVKMINPKSFSHWDVTFRTEDAFKRVEEHRAGNFDLVKSVKKKSDEILKIPATKFEMIELIKKQHEEILSIKHHQEDQIRKILEVTGRMTWDESFIIPINQTDHKSPFDEIFDSLAILLNDFKEIIQDKILHAKLLEESEEKYKNLIDLASDIIVVYQDDILKFVNSRVYQILGYTVDEVIGNNMFGYVVPEEVPRLQEYYRRRISGEATPWIYETVLLHKDGHRVPISMSVGRIIYENKPAVMLIARDITQKRKIEEELDKYRTHLEDIIRKRTEQLQKEMTERKIAEEADRLKTAFLSNMSHEIRTPMNAIISFSNFLKDQNISVDQKNEYVNYIISSGQSLLNLLNDIIDISKIEAKQIDIQSEICEINPILDELYKLFEESRKKLAKDNLQIILQKSETSNISLNIDPYRLKQILSNLLDNALKFTEKGSIEFGYRLNNKDIVFYVKDTGIGIPEGKKEFIFKRFGRLNLTKRNTHGAGLGLAISKNLVSLLNGELWVESKEGEGATFYLKILDYILPKKVEIRETQNVETKEAYLWNTKTILIAEDEDLNFRVLQIALAKTGATIIRATTGVEAINIIEDNKSIDIVLMDIQMPEMDGYEAMSKIKKAFPSKPIIAQTAFALLEEKKKCIDLGFDDYISKPIKLDELLQKIDNHFH